MTRLVIASCSSRGGKGREGEGGGGRGREGEGGGGGGRGRDGEGREGGKEGREGGKEEVGAITQRPVWESHMRFPYWFTNSREISHMSRLKL